MIPAHFPAMILAELKKVFTRGSGIATLVVALLLGLGGPAALSVVQNAVESGVKAQSNGQPMGAMVEYTALTASVWSLNARNFFVLPLMLLLATASSLVGELNDRTLREVVVRPVSRFSVLLAKLLSLFVLSVASLLCTLIPSLAVGVGLYGPPTDGAQVGPLLLGYLASVPSDLTVIAIGLLGSLFLGSVGGVVVASVFLLLADLALWAGLQFLGVIGVPAAQDVIPWTLGYALDAWQGSRGGDPGWEWQPFLSLLVIFSASFAATLGRFSRMDVP